MNAWARRATFLARVAAVLAILVLAGVSPAAVYVVDQAAPGSADTNPGTDAKPFKTVQHAADLAKPGDTVYVMLGRYEDRVKVAASGEAGRPITFQAMPRRSAVVGGFDLQGSYVRVAGFEITADTPAVAVQLNGSHCEVLDNYIHDMMMGVGGTGGKPNADPNTRDYSAVAHNRVAGNQVVHCEYGFMLGGDDWVVENNEVRRLFMYSPGKGNDDSDYTRFFGKGCVQRYNYYHGTLQSEIKNAHTDVLQTFTNNGEIAQDLLFEFNTCFDYGQGCMVESAPHVGSVRNWTFRYNLYSSKLPTFKGASGLNLIQTPDVTIENNTFSGFTWYGSWLRGKESTNGKVLNNLFADVETSFVDRDRGWPEGSNPVIEYNLTFKASPLAGPKNQSGKDPLFVDAANRNFRLKKGSPAVGAGKDGKTIGALENPNIYYVDPRHAAAADEPAWGYPGVPLASLAKACEMAMPGEIIVLRGGVYREALCPANDGVTVRTINDEKVTISGADVIEGWRRQNQEWWAPVLAEPKKVLRDGQPWADFLYDRVGKRIVMKADTDPRLHVFETVVRAKGIDLTDRKDVKIEGVTEADLAK
jgi:hypothetical protein